jgi:hypothetical protein
MKNDSCEFDALMISSDVHVMFTSAALAIILRNHVLWFLSVFMMFDFIVMVRIIWYLASAFRCKEERRKQSRRCSRNTIQDC